MQDFCGTDVEVGDLVAFPSMHGHAIFQNL